MTLLSSYFGLFLLVAISTIQLSKSHNIPFNQTGAITGIDRLGHWPSDGLSASSLNHLDYIRDPRKNKGLGFSLEERQRLKLHGLLPPVFKTQDEQLALIKVNLDRYTDPLSKYTYFMGLQERNEKLFYRFLNEYLEEAMPIVYTPTVGLACQNYGLVYRQPKGLFITIHDKGHVYDILSNWPESDVRAIVVTDGESILGLGDLGAQGMGIPVGKLALYTALAGIKPHQCLPITIDTGTNTQKLLEDPLYIGLREKRVRGNEYDELLDEFMQAVVRRFGQSVLIQFEDFSSDNAFRLLEKYKNKYLTFNADTHATGAVAVAGLLSSLRVTHTKLSDHTILFQGAGTANLGTAELCVMAMMEEGLSRDDARSKIWMVDSKGLIVVDRPEGGINERKLKFAHKSSPIKELVDVIKTVKPTVLIGASAIAGAFTPEILMQMAKNSPTPVIFALSNPTHKAEATAEDVYTHTNGTALFASGSPSPPFVFRGKTHYPGQANNAYIFPGIALGVIAAGVRHISDQFFLESSRTLAALVEEADLEKGMLYPPLSQIRNCSDRIAQSIIEFGYKNGVASVYPEPEDKVAFIKSQQYNFSYSPALPRPYSWPTKL